MARGPTKAQLVEQNAQNEARIAQLEGQNTQNETLIAQLAGQNAQNEARIAQLEEKNAQNEARFAQLEEQNAQNEARIAQLEEENVSLRAANAGFRGLAMQDEQSTSASSTPRRILAPTPKPIRTISRQALEKRAKKEAAGILAKYRGFCSNFLMVAKVVGSTPTGKNSPSSSVERRLP